LSDVYKNQTGIVDIEMFNYLKIAIVGVGSIGSFLAIALNKLGFKNIILIDDDIVEEHNPTTQFYFPSDVNKTKVTALSHYLKGNVSTYKAKVTSKNKIDADIVFLCVDSLVARKVITKAILESYLEFKRPKLIIDGRMHRLIFSVYTIRLDDQKLMNKYVQSTMEESFEGNCTEKGIIQNIFGVVGVMIEQLKKTLNGEDYNAIIECDFERLVFITSEEKTFKKVKKGSKQ